MNARNDIPQGEPSREVIEMRDTIIMIAAMIGKMDEAAARANALKTGMPVELIPLVQMFNEGRIQTTEIIAAWMEIGGRQTN